VDVAIDITGIHIHTANNSTAIGQNLIDVASHTSTLATVEIDIASNLTDIASNTSSISGIASDLTDLDIDLLVDLGDYLSVDTTDDSVIFTDANVYVQSGSGSTDGTVNGLGNLIVGYDEDGGSDDKSGSHNVIIGMEHQYTGAGNLISGYRHEVDNDFSGMVGGFDHFVGATYSGLVGGVRNTTLGTYSSVLGGRDSTATGDVSSIGGGTNNNATGHGTTIGGGDGTTHGTDFRFFANGNTM
jgi:hypothetical protein